ncbi:co-chaperone HscB [Neiella marina]|uniref:Co-chaperone protein HscB homolog n=1 Tax=Neiella holothuriorum TaxID=2870530 RepID=A0ABS7EK53_9GAMM|nr:co-chaperone HscB [Neiella holothuriorum]MBW8192737.1 co-chaperone HscB [Neiella holothuriorum]
MNNYFQLFGLTEQFSLDQAALMQTYRDLQKSVHPDHYANQGQQAQRLAVQKSAQINDAYQTLKSPLLRAQYMLLLVGVELKGEQQTLRDPMFLMQQMEWREELDDLKRSQDIDKLEAFSDAISAERAALNSNIASAFDAGEHRQDVQTWANEVRKLSFMDKLLTEIAQAEDALDY